MKASERRILGPVATELRVTYRHAFKELKRCVDLHDPRATPVGEYAVFTFLAAAEDRVRNLPEHCKQALADTDRFSESMVRGYAFAVVEELIRRADVAARRSFSTL